MTDLDSKARVAAVYDEIDKELRERKLRAIWACLAALVLSIAWVLYSCGTLPTKPAVRRPGTVLRTVQVEDDTGHDVRLVVALDHGPSVLVPISNFVPIGARVVIGERKNLFGWSRYAFIGHESASKGR